MPLLIISMTIEIPGIHTWCNYRASILHSSLVSMLIPVSGCGFYIYLIYDYSVNTSSSIRTVPFRLKGCSSSSPPSQWVCVWFWVQVVRAAEEAASTLAGSIHPEQCIKVLCPIVQTADYPINLAAIKMQTKVIERIAKESLLQLLVDIIPGLLQVRYATLHNTVTDCSAAARRLLFHLSYWYFVTSDQMAPTALNLPLNTPVQPLFYDVCKTNI